MMTKKDKETRVRRLCNILMRQRMASKAEHTPEPGCMCVSCLYESAVNGVERVLASVGSDFAWSCGGPGEWEVFRSLVLAAVNEVAPTVDPTIVGSKCVKDVTWYEHTETEELGVLTAVRKTGKDALWIESVDGTLVCVPTAVLANFATMVNKAAEPPAPRAEDNIVPMPQDKCKDGEPHTPAAGPRVPDRNGSFPTEVCSKCGRWRISPEAGTPAHWRRPEALKAAMQEEEDA